MRRLREGWTTGPRYSRRPRRSVAASPRVSSAGDARSPERDRHLRPDLPEVVQVGVTIVGLARPDRRMTKRPLDLRVGQSPRPLGVGRPRMPKREEREARRPRPPGPRLEPVEGLRPGATRPRAVGRVARERPGQRTGARVARVRISSRSGAGDRHRLCRGPGLELAAGRDLQHPASQARSPRPSRGSPRRPGPREGHGQTPGRRADRSSHDSRRPSGADARGLSRYPRSGGEVHEPRVGQPRPVVERADRERRAGA